ncbi:MAG: hypothetical protein ACUVTD_01615 [Nitrososphaerales archaeon]
MKIVLSEHAKQVLQEREISLDLIIEEVIKKANYRLYGVREDAFVAIKRIQIREKVFGLIVAYAKLNDEHKLITVYPSKDYIKYTKGKVKRGRWFSL